MVMIMLTFGQKLKNLREYCNLTQSALGEKIKLTQRKISYLENDTCEPAIDDIKAICTFFGVSADYFLTLPKNLKYPDKL